MKEVTQLAKLQNHAKNVSLYAGVYMDKFVKPADIFDKDKAEAIIDINKHLFDLFTESGFHLQSFKSLHKKDYQPIARMLFEKNILNSSNQMKKRPE